MSGTITRTITNYIVATVTACPPTAVTSVPTCVLGQVTTRTSVYVTTICPEETAKPVPASGGTGAAVTAPAPAPTPAMGGGPGAGAGAAAAQAPQGDQGGVVFVTVTEQCHTSTYAVTSCASNAAGCTVGMTTTQLYTEYRTVTTTAPALQAIQTMSAELLVFPAVLVVVVAAATLAILLLLEWPCRPLYKSAVARLAHTAIAVAVAALVVVITRMVGISAAAAACAGASCVVVAPGAVPTTTMPVYAGAERSMGAAKGWWTAVGVGALILVLGGS